MFSKNVHAFFLQDLYWLVFPLKHGMTSNVLEFIRFAYVILGANFLCWSTVLTTWKDRSASNVFTFFCRVFSVYSVGFVWDLLSGLVDLWCFESFYRRLLILRVENWITFRIYWGCPVWKANVCSQEFLISLCFYFSPILSLSAAYYIKVCLLWRDWLYFCCTLLFQRLTLRFSLKSWKYYFIILYFKEIWT